MSTAQNTRARRPTTLLGALIGAVVLLGLAAPASALAAPVLELRSSFYPPIVSAGSYAQYELTVSNSGDVRTAGAVNIAFTLPAGLQATSAVDGVFKDTGGFLSAWTCTILDPQSVSCRSRPGIGGPILPDEEACVSGPPIQPCHIYLIAKADPGLSPGTPLPVSVQACGGGAAGCANDAQQIESAPPPAFEIKSFDGDVLDEIGDPVTQAGSHPHTGFTEFFASTILDPNGAEYSVEDIQDATVKLPPGLVGNPQVVPPCTQAQILNIACPPESQVGEVLIWSDGVPAISNGGSPGNPARFGPSPVYRMQTPFGTPALFAFSFGEVIIQVYARVRTGTDYGVTVLSKNAPQTLPFEGVFFEFWGAPADASHDAARGGPSSAPLRPFITLPTSCTGPVETFLTLTSWLGSSADGSFLTAPGGTGCNAVPFEPTLEARPTTNVGDAPSGLDVDLRIPQDDNPNGIATAHLRDTTVTLPEGLVINPSGANGLGACSLAEFGLTSAIGAAPIQTTPGAATCPDASKVASVEVNSPLVDHPLKGSAHIAQPYANPFNSLLALYITLDDPQTGTVVKLAGKVSPDPDTGRLTSTFENNPQLPFETFRLNFKAGAHGALRTPAICGNHTTTSSLTPWSTPDSGPPADPSDTWQITQNCSGSAGEQPHAPGFDAGSVSPLAGRHSPFVVHLRREDGSQQFSAVTVSPPQGLVAKLAGTPACSDAALAAAAGKAGVAEQASPSCPLASQIGNVDVAAGAGPAPYHAPAKAYLSGPYKSAPLSMAVIAPAVAGPFDLGTVVTRIALHINPATAEITAVSDPVPSILQGIPLDIKTISVSLDKPEFALTGTSCDPSAVNGLLTSTLGAVANLSARYQLAECTGLGFKPRMALRLRGGTKRGKHPQLSAYVLPRAGDANIRSVSVAFPRSEFLENAHIRTICTRPDFAADNCPAGAVYGTSTVFTPLLDYPLTGNVYLRSSNNLLPDVVPDLRGPAHQPIKVEAAGRTDSIRGGIRNTFDFFPDAPFTRAILRMQGGDKGLLVNSRNICARTYRATVKFVGHNGARHTIRPKLVAQSCKKKKRRKAKRSSHSRSKRMALATRSSVR